MRWHLAFLTLLVGCGGSTDNGTSAGTGGQGASSTDSGATGGRSYIPVPSAGGAATGGSAGFGLGGLSAVGGLVGAGGNAGATGLGQPFSCGINTCFVGVSYCVTLMGGGVLQATNLPATNGTSNCAPLPTSCAQATDCTCLQSIGVFSCTATNGEIFVTEVAV
jgi:hypothetical protein